MTRKFFAALLAIAASLTLHAQQDPLYSQHVYNKLPLNPAYAGSRDAISAVALYRRQWVSFPGAPTTATVSLHSPLRNRKLALGLNVTADELGITGNNTASASFAYRVPAGDGQLAFGLQASVNQLRVALTDATSAVENDPSLAADVNAVQGNAGFGVFYHAERYYLGAAIPNLIENRYGAALGAPDQVAERKRHYYAMAGYVMDLSRDIKLRPTALVRYVPNAPIQADLGAALLLQERIWVGGQYRTIGAMDLHVEYQASETLRFGYSFGQQLGKLGAQTFGSHEILVGVDLPTRSSRKPKRGSIRCFF